MVSSFNTLPAIITGGQGLHRNPPVPTSSNSSSALFQAQSRPQPTMKWAHLRTVCKIIFFPIYYICSRIAFSFGVGATPNINEARRNELKLLGGREVRFLTEDNRKLEGMHFVNPRAAPHAKTILICTGSHASYEGYAVPMVDAILELGHNAMVFNYRGFGRSEGSPSEKGFYLDTEAAYQYLKHVHQQSDEQLKVLGYSMGSALATDLAAHHSIGLILDRYFSSMRDVAYDQGGLIAKTIFYLGGANFDNVEKIKKVRGEILLAKGIFDPMTKPYQNQYLREALSSHPNATFIEARTSHIHGSNQSLWFHPENTENAQPLERFCHFLSSPVIRTN